MNIVLLKDKIAHQGGLEKYVRRLADAFAHAGHTVTILTTGPIPINTTSPVRFVNLGSPYHLSLANVLLFDRACNKWLCRNPHDVVFGMDRTTFQTHYRAGNGVHAAYLDRRRKSDSWAKGLSFSINPLHHTILRYERQAFQHPALRLLFTNSEMVKREVLSYYDVDPKKLAVVHNGVEWHEWQSPFDNWTEQRPSLLAALGLDPNCFQLLFIGHGFRRKGLQHLITALEKHGRRDLQLSVVGKDKETPFFRELVDRHRLTKTVKFFGPRPDIISFYQAADALAIPSTYDPFANVTIEALAMGLFVLSSKDNGGHEVLSPSCGTIIDDVTDVDAFVAALEQTTTHPKTPQSSESIRQSAQRYDFSSQLQSIVLQTLSSV